MDYHADVHGYAHQHRYAGNPYGYKLTRSTYVHQRPHQQARAYHY